MKLQQKVSLFVFLGFIIWLFIWALFIPKENLSDRIQRTIKQQEKKADLSFSQVTFEEITNGKKYWALTAQKADINKSTQIATLKDSNGSFYKKGKEVLRFKSPAALWDMSKKEIFLDKPLGYDVKLENKIDDLIEKIKNLPASRQVKKSIFTLPQSYKGKTGYWFLAKNLSWRLINKQLVCDGGISLTKGNVTGIAQKLSGDVAMERVTLSGKPKIVIFQNKSAPITMEAKTFAIISNKDTILAKGNPKITWQTATINAREMTYFQGINSLNLLGSVKVKYNDIEAVGDSAQYFAESGKIVLSGQAKATQGENKLNGKKVIVSLKDQKISVVGRGKVIISEEEIN